MNVEQIIRELAGSAAQANENAYDITNAKADIAELQRFGNLYDMPLDYEEGDVIEWKPGLRNPCNRFPAYGEPVLCHKLDESRRDPFREACDSAGSSNSVDDLVVAIKRVGGILFYSFDSRRFRKYRAPSE